MNLTTLVAYSLLPAVCELSGGVPDGRSLLALAGAGLAMLTTPLWLQVRPPILHGLAYTLTVTGQIILWPLLVLFFYRVVYRLPPAEA